jgi:REP element-mobilizing transposase RayT
MATSILSRRNLPHIQREGATYHVSWSLARRKLALGPDERDIVMTSLRHFNEDRYDLHAAVVMDDHIHVLVTPRPGRPLPMVLHSWKSFTAHVLVRLGRTAPVWVAEYYDTIIRDSEHFLATKAYILANPRRRWPRLTGYRWMIDARPSGPPSSF